MMVCSSLACQILLFRLALAHLTHHQPAAGRGQIITVAAQHRILEEPFLVMGSAMKIKMPLVQRSRNPFLSRAGRHICVVLTVSF